MSPAKVASVLLVVGIFLVAWFLSQTTSIPPTPTTPTNIQTSNLPAPTISFTTIQGQSFTLQSLPTQGIIVNVWASWCAPCVAEMPSLLGAIQQSNGKLSLVALGWDTSSTQPQANKIIQQAQNIPHVYWVPDPTQSLAKTHFGTQQVPETILINVNRLMQFKVIGSANWQTPTMAALLNQIGQ